jgi:hypothetical protein
VKSAPDELLHVVNGSVSSAEKSQGAPCSSSRRQRLGPFGRKICSHHSLSITRLNHIELRPTTLVLEVRHDQTSRWLFGRSILSRFGCTGPDGSALVVSKGKPVPETGTSGNAAPAVKRRRPRETRGRCTRSMQSTVRAGPDARPAPPEHAEVVTSTRRRACDAFATSRPRRRRARDTGGGSEHASMNVLDGPWQRTEHVGHILPNACSCHEGRVPPPAGALVLPGAMN